MSFLSMAILRGLSCPVAILQDGCGPGSQPLIHYLRNFTNKGGRAEIPELEILRTSRKGKECM